MVMIACIYRGVFVFLLLFLSFHCFFHFSYGSLAVLCSLVGKVFVDLIRG